MCEIIRNMKIETWLESARQQLAKANIPSAQLDVELLLSRTLDKPREYLLAYGEEELPTSVENKASEWLKKRAKREPLAYIFGEKEFYGRNFIVSPDTLIPRPDTEIVIELAKKYSLQGRVLDVGTGSGCIGLTLKAENPDINLTLSDISPEALEITRKNAKVLDIKPVRYVVSDLLEHWLGHEKPKQFNVIIANLPYVDRSWEVSIETKYEPDIALFAPDTGLELIKKLIDQSEQLVATNGYLVLEADPRQHKAIVAYASNYSLVEINEFIVVLRKN